MTKLTDFQERVLIVLADRARDDAEKGQERRWHVLSTIEDETLAVRHVGYATIYRLQRMGLVEMEQVSPRLATMRARATDRGVALCNSMGD